MPYSAVICQFGSCRRALVFRYNVQLQSGINFRVQANSNIEFTNRADRTFRQTNFSFRQFNARFGNQISDIIPLTLLPNLTHVYLGGNKLNQEGINIHVPDLESQGVDVNL